MTTETKRAIALGFFDGLHLAHRRVLDTARSAAGFRPAALLFDRAPQEVLTGAPPQRLMTAADQRARLREMGFEILEASFAALRDLSPEAFVREYLARELKAGFVACGFNYTFGRDGAGDAALLQRLCAEAGVSVSVLPAVKLDDAVISSSAVRAALRAGEPERAAVMCGAPFSFAAPVVHGERRGRLLGAPTANQILPAELVVPKCGVYAADVTLPDGRTLRGVTNIGSRPTFQGVGVRSETFLPGFSGDLYGETLRVALLRFLREERRFADADALRRQIARDAEQALQAEGPA